MKNGETAPPCQPGRMLLSQKKPRAAASHKDQGTPSLRKKYMATVRRGPRGMPEERLRNCMWKTYSLTGPRPA